MMRHSVIFTLACTAGSAEEAAFLAAAEKLSAIPGVQDFEIFRQTSKKNPFTFGITMAFASQELYDAYSGHNAHVNFIEAYWLKYVDGFLEIDYAPLDGNQVL